MKDPIFFLLLGLGPGALFAMIGASMVVAYKGSGVINFAMPAMANFVVFDYISMRLSGQIVMPWIDILPTDKLNLPVNISVGSSNGIGLVPAFVLAMLMAVLLGLAVHFLVFRPLRNAPPLGKVIGSIGILTYLTGIMNVNFRALNNPNPKDILPHDPLRNFLWLGSNHVVSESILWLTAIALAVGIGLWALYRYTRFGVATRAASSNEKGAVLLGYSPEFLAATNWVLASVVAGFAAIIVGPFGGSLSPVQLTALLGFFLAAMLIGRLTSTVWATIGGLVLGMITSWASSWLIAQHWFPQWLRNGVSQAIPLIAIVIVLFATGKSLPTRGTVEEKRLPLAPYPKRMLAHTIIWSAVVIVIAYAGRHVFDGGIPFALQTALITSILMLSYVVLTGYVGQISLAQLGFAGVAAFFMARMMANGSVTSSNPFPVSGLNLHWLLAAVMGILMAIAVGLILAIPALRIRGVQLAVVTIAAAVALQSLYFENDKLTGLRAGAPASVKIPSLFGVDFGSAGNKGLTNNPPFLIFCLVMLVGCCWLVANLRQSGTGRRFLSVRANERAAAAAGVNVARTKMLAFAFSAGLAGLAGVLFAFQANNVSSAQYIFSLGLPVLAFAYLAGITSINGAIVGGLLVPVSLIATLSGYYFKQLNIQDYIPIIGGIGLVVTAIIHPEGIAPYFQPVMRYAGNWLVKARTAQWIDFAKRYVTWIVGAWIVGYLLWPLRVSSYNKFWMPFVAVILTMMFIRPISLAIYAKIKGKPVTALPGHEGDAAAAAIGQQPPSQVVGAAHASTEAPA